MIYFPPWRAMVQSMGFLCIRMKCLDSSTSARRFVLPPYSFIDSVSLITQYANDTYSMRPTNPSRVPGLLDVFICTWRVCFCLFQVTIILPVPIQFLVSLFRTGLYIIMKWARPWTYDFNFRTIQTAVLIETLTALGAEVTWSSCVSIKETIPLLRLLISLQFPEHLLDPGSRCCCVCSVSEPFYS